ncbi:hypothetical protein [Limnovirga soli]|uniref:Uncharacterized protein n=1 Tax=Limnovirga soli TaxID=2656915 RepID=A0A8J8FBK9_9BACT|nr:hypothetical protein [Limnovirga soli]NNV54552.1 hypothetical protein [Limnovirga soli]
MKLLNLFFSLFLWFANTIIYILSLPVRLFKLIYYLRLNSRWRKDVSVDDICYVKDAIGQIRRCRIIAKSADGESAFVALGDYKGCVKRWFKINQLFIKYLKDKNTTHAKI